jgi:ABC-2 type transport system permease protein
MITFGLYPAEIFPGVVRILLYTLIPAAFVGSVPAALLVDFSWRRLTTLIAVTAAFTFLAWGVFRWGLRRYESGNLVSVRG